MLAWAGRCFSRAFGGDLVDADARRDRSAADESHAALLENFLKLAALAESAVEHGKDDIGRMIQPG